MRLERLVYAVAVLGGFTIIQGACTVSEGDDDDSSVGASGGTTGGSGGSDTGGTSTGGTSTGGTSTGGTSTGGTGGGEPPNACETAIVATCSNEWDGCTGDCADEFGCTQDCIADIVTTDGFVNAADQSSCAEGCAANSAYVTTAMNELFNCMQCDQSIADECLGGYDSAAVCN